ncbi:SDR family NAD(P)-dependent oxidoreductase, partial [Candidatus Accumulibacter vicinus]|uniref:SDR family NAD(P)-dependent oxidoreductase n=1 Tax=Candidatus Accumulibacter vicinus TaxID=2954382 RepID=UPI0005522FDC
MDLWACPAVVTGAASGLGAETARYLIEAGAKVAVIDIDAEGVQRVADEIGALAIPCDVADALSAEQAIAMAREAHGAARVLVHCVGRGHCNPIVGASGPMPLEDFRQLVEVNLISTFNMM